MKRRLIVLAMLVCLVALSISAAAEGSLSERREYVQNCLQQAYTFFGEKDASDMEELEAALDIPMTEEIVYSSACIGNTVYILARYGIFAIETEGSYTYYPFDGDKTTRQDFPIEIFTVDG